MRSSTVCACWSCLHPAWNRFSFRSCAPVGYCVSFVLFRGCYADSESPAPLLPTSTHLSPYSILRLSKLIMLTVQPISPGDMPTCASIIIPSFSNDPISATILGPNTPHNHALLSSYHLTGHKEHSTKYPSVPPAVKCVYTSPEGESKIIGFAEWLVYDRERTEDEHSTENYILRLEWMEETERQKCLNYMKPMIDARVNLLKGRKHAFLMFLCVDEAFRGKGAGKALVKWGMEQCDKIGVPGYLEASDDGKRLYENLGWVVVGEEKLPGMMYFPPGLAREAWAAGESERAES